MLIADVAAKNVQFPDASVYVLSLFYHISLCDFGFFIPSLNPKKFRTVSRVKIVMYFVILKVPLSSLKIWWHLCFVHQMNTVQVLM